MKNKSYFNLQQTPQPSLPRKITYQVLSGQIQKRHSRACSHSSSTSANPQLETISIPSPKRKVSSTIPKQSFLKTLLLFDSNTDKKTKKVDNFFQEVEAGNARQKKKELAFYLTNGQAAGKTLNPRVNESVEMQDIRFPSREKQVTKRGGRKIFFVVNDTIQAKKDTTGFTLTNLGGQFFNLKK